MVSRERVMGLVRHGLYHPANKAWPWSPTVSLVWLFCALYTMTIIIFMTVYYTCIVLKVAYSNSSRAYT
jgi:hypothetical protein